MHSDKYKVGETVSLGYADRIRKVGVIHSKKDNKMIVKLGKDIGLKKDMAEASIGLRGKLWAITSIVGRRMYLTYRRDLTADELKALTLPTVRQCVDKGRKEAEKEYEGETALEKKVWDEVEFTYVGYRVVKEEELENLPAGTSVLTFKQLDAIIKEKMEKYLNETNTGS